MLTGLHPSAGTLAGVMRRKMENSRTCSRCQQFFSPPFSLSGLIFSFSKYFSQFPSSLRPQTTYFPFCPQIKCLPSFPSWSHTTCLSPLNSFLLYLETKWFPLNKLPSLFFPVYLLEPLNILQCIRWAMYKRIVSESVVPDLRIIWLIHRKQIERSLTSLQSFVLVMCPQIIGSIL